MCDEDIQRDIEYYRTYLFSQLEIEIRKRNLAESLQVDEVQLVLEPKNNGGSLVCCYYFVSPRTRSLFWLDTWEAESIFKDCRGILSPSHKGKFQAAGPGTLIERFESIRFSYPSRLLVCHIRELCAVRYLRV